MLDHLDDLRPGITSECRSSAVIGLAGASYHRCKKVSQPLKPRLSCDPAVGHRRMKIRPWTMPREVYNSTLEQQVGEFGDNARGRVSYEDPVEKKPVTAEALREGFIPSTLCDELRPVRCLLYGHHPQLTGGGGGREVLLLVLPSEAGGRRENTRPPAFALLP